MTIFDRFRDLAAASHALSAQGLTPFGITMERMLSATEAVIAGRRTILAGTNNYLGLTWAPECVAAARDAVTAAGTGTTGSRVANGTFAGHVALEQELALFFARPSAIVFSTGYLANLGVLSALPGPDGVVLIDSDCHASIYDGCRLGGAETIRFRHNDVGDLDRRLRRLGDRARGALIVVEGLYSMLGDRAPLAALAATKQQHGAYLLVDEAHAVGVLGATGRGMAEEAGVEDAVDFVVGTFSKSLGSTGGFCVSPHPELELLRLASRPYVFTASLSPSVIASTRMALKLLRERPELRERLWDNARRLHARLSALGWVVGPEPSPIVAVLVARAEEATELWSTLLARGVYVNLVLPPAAPSRTCLLRVSVTAAHTTEQIEQIGDAFAAARVADGCAEPALTSPSPQRQGA